MRSFFKLLELSCLTCGWFLFFFSPSAIANMFAKYSSFSTEMRIILFPCCLPFNQLYHLIPSSDRKTRADTLAISQLGKKANCTGKTGQTVWANKSSPAVVQCLHVIFMKLDGGNDILDLVILPTFIKALGGMEALFCFLSEGHWNWKGFSCVELEELLFKHWRLFATLPYVPKQESWLL